MMIYLILLFLNNFFSFGNSAVLLSNSHQQLIGKLSHFMSTFKKCSKVSISFVWLLAIFEVAENPERYSFLPYKNILVTFFLVVMIIYILFVLSRDNIANFLSKLFHQMLRNNFWKKIICWYCYLIFSIRGFFEFDFWAFRLGFMSPYFIYLYEYITNQIPLLANPFFWMAFWFSLGVSLLFIDEIGVKIYQFIKNVPEHLFSKYFLEFKEKRSQDVFLQKGFIPTMGKITAAGQGALFAAVGTAITGVGVSFINNYYLDKRDIRDSTARAAREAADRQAQTAKEAADRVAKATKTAAKMAEAERLREHERAKWAHEEKMKQRSSWFK